MREDCELNEYIGSVKKVLVFEKYDGDILT